MKKILLIGALCSVLFTNAQKDKREEGIKFGVKGGLNVANFMGDIDNNAIRTGIHIGLVSEIILSDKFSFQPEVLYSGQGFSNQNPDAFSREKFDYVNVPLLIKHYVVKNVSIEAGPQVGFLVSAKDRTPDSNESIDDQKTVDFGLDLGLGYELKNGVFFQARYNLGLTNINAAPDADAVKYTNSVFQFSIGAFF